jgi:hypothetical protein
MTHKQKGAQLSNWNSLGISDLDTYNFGIQNGWQRVGDSQGFRKTVQSDSFIVNLTALTHSPGEAGITVVGFGEHSSLPEFTPTMFAMSNANWPTWDDAPEFNRTWANLLLKQGSIFRETLKVAMSETSFLHDLFEGWTGSTSARSRFSVKPKLSGEQLTVTALDEHDELIVLDIIAVSIRQK